ncbi:hypothetical protein SKAU_G00157100 [Synaphobranchus kaupii]|uniref:Uncharacterized protein n=1 Tax=Synaphobranchus kaupii TaxID=118154 RepID=A0A9Q1FHT1_SYNKA|nr:hypothetical protein SKAU_G00157100 [Synaphobranchus kaupii]
MQEKRTDILKASALLKNSIRVLVEYREQFDEAKSTTLALATKWGSQTQFDQTRARKVKRHYDELCEDSRLYDAENNFRVNVFYACLDIIIQQLSKRFTSLNATAHMFEAIHPNTLQQAQDEELHQAARRLTEHYSRDIAPSFPGWSGWGPFVRSAPGPGVTMFRHWQEGMGCPHPDAPPKA